MTTRPETAPGTDLVPPQLRRLKQRAEFLFVAQGISAARGAVVVQMRPRPGAPADQAGIGFTATKKVGGAVVRNRAKRRMREAARALLPQLGRGGCDYVFVARIGAGERPWARFLDDVRGALVSLAAGGDGPRPPRKPPRQARSQPASPQPSEPGPTSAR